MQLGELQSQIERFETRGIAVVAVSVDTVQDSTDIISRLGLTFDLASDPEQVVVKKFRVQNPETRELALHAVYIVDKQGKVFYRKIARRRPTSVELIDAIDAHRGEYPSSDTYDSKRRRITVAYPENIFQALIEVSAVAELPESIDASHLTRAYSLLMAGQTDDSLIAFRNLVRSSNSATEVELLEAAAWLVRRVFFDGNAEVDVLGADLTRRLTRVQQLEDAHAAAENATNRDELLHKLSGARAGLSATRASVSNKSVEWNLNFAKAMLRSYREVAKAASRGDR